MAAAVGPGLEAFGATAALMGLAGFRLRLEPVSASAGLKQLATRCTGLALDAPLPLAETIRTGRPVASSSIPEEVLEAPFQGGTGTVRALALPIIGSRGVAGGIWLFLGPERWPYESALLSVLVARLGSAIDRTRLLESERRLRARAEQAAARLSRLQSLTSGLSAALGAADVAETVMTHAAAELGATGATCFMLAEDTTLRPLGSVGDDTGAPHWISLTNGESIETVLRRSGVVIVPGAPGVSRGVDPVAPRAIVPLSIRGTILGAIELTFPPDRDVDGELRSFLAALGAQCVQAIDRARLYEQRAKEARVLQASLLPTALPRIPGLDVGASYRPFGDGTVVGGDFYDLYELGGGRWGLVVGDVAGRGIEAAATTALARFTTRAAALLGSGPAEVLRILNRVMVSESLGERFCTIVHAVLEPTAEGSEVTMSLGGHPRPLLLERRTGEVRAVGATGTAVGLLDDPVLRDTKMTMASGDVLVFFTDGCVDIHGEDGTTSDEGVLVEVLREHADANAIELTKRLEEAVMGPHGGQGGDDAALLVVRVKGDER
jgi:GAF domain-containing protein